MSLEETKVRLLAASGAAEGLLAQVNELYVQEIGSEEKFLEEALSELHNSGEIDLVELVKTVDRSSFGYDFFTIQHAFENALLSLEASVEDVLHCLVHLTQQAGRDLAIGGVYGAFQRFCSLETDRPRDSVEVILNQSELDAYASFLSSSILAFHSDNVTEAIQIAESLSMHENKTVRSQAYFTLGRLDVGEAQTNVIWDLFSANANSERDCGCCASLLRAILNFGEKYPSYWQPIEELLITFVNSAPPEVQYEISDIVAFQRVGLPERIFHTLVKQLANVSPEHYGIISNIDYVLVNLIEQGLSSLAIELLESNLMNGVTLPSFGHCSRELLSNYKELLGQLTTKWFLSGEVSLCRGVFDLLHDVTGKDIEVEADMSVLNDYGSQIFVCHKVVGWLFTRPAVATSFLLSMYKACTEIVQKEIESLLYAPLLLSYPREVKGYLQTCVEGEVQIELCERLLGKLNQYHDDLEQISSLKELRAPSENVSTYWRDFNRSMQKAKDEGPKSVFEEICTVQNLLYGNSSIYYMDDGSGEPIRQEMQMQSFSHSSEIPRLNVLDPEHLDFMLRIYRHEVMKDEADS